jgi:hypothetical protein
MIERGKQLNDIFKDVIVYDVTINAIYVPTASFAQIKKS